MDGIFPKCGVLIADKDMFENKYDNHEQLRLTILPSWRSTPRQDARRPLSVRSLSSFGEEMNPIECRASKLRDTELTSGGSRVL